MLAVQFEDIMSIEDIAKKWSECQRGIRPSMTFDQAIDDMQELVAEMRRLQRDNKRLNADAENARLMAANNGQAMIAEISDIVRKYS
ncbi:MAG: hypothetical protein C1943_05750 [Halochromatium sp.]|nr:hypothetical protein [Halochromatium sp.]